MKRTEARNKAMIILYQHYLLEEDVIKLMNELLEVPNSFVESLVVGVTENQEKINELVNANMTDWTIERLGKTDQAILSIGTYELIFTDTPEIVCINEAVELAKQFSDDKVVGIINKVLDKIYKSK
jgi:N utilization substance protein B